ncbi:protein tyrosine phosphatase [Fibrella sp. HMF5335]|uniref:Protein tyrosine phosphatase n=1 Tax=Fibrella rubiginis TaxID=2817060 RepID=A0A939K346_9BACT|nr:protein tyrosine phosphatase [Fibrella rubiginis]MBO0935258.1 protein tyrosine phosphatase [Fibrella rubiginis]
MPTKLLFVCSRNRKRSLTAEHVFAHEPHYAVRSAGTEAGARTKLTPGLLGWADVVFVMEIKHRDWIQRRYSDLVANKPLVNLLVADNYACMDEELVDILISRVTTYLSEP